MPHHPTPFSFSLIFFFLHCRGLYCNRKVKRWQFIFGDREGWRSLLMAASKLSHLKRASSVTYGRPKKGQRGREDNSTNSFLMFFILFLYFSSANHLCKGEDELMTINRGCQSIPPKVPLFWRNWPSTGWIKLQMLLDNKLIILIDKMSAYVVHAPLTLSKGMPYFFRMDGDISVILWRRKASQPWELPGKNPERSDREHVVLKEGGRGNVYIWYQHAPG